MGHRVRLGPHTEYASGRNIPPDWRCWVLPYLQAFSAQAGMLALGMHSLPMERGLRRHDVHWRHNRVAVP